MFEVCHFVEIHIRPQVVMIPGVLVLKFLETV